MKKRGLNLPHFVTRRQFHRNHVSPCGDRRVALVLAIAPLLLATGVSVTFSSLAPHGDNHQFIGSTPPGPRTFGLGTALGGQSGTVNSSGGPAQVGPVYPVPPSYNNSSNRLSKNSTPSQPTGLTGPWSAQTSSSASGSYTDFEPVWGGYAFCATANVCGQTQQTPFVPGSAGIGQVSARWTVPTAECTGGNCNYQFVSTWVGIGGDGANDLIQLGTYVCLYSPGCPNGWGAFAFLEMNPSSSAAVMSLFPVSMGDQVNASEWYVGLSGGEQQWRFSIQDTSTGSYYNHTQLCDPGAPTYCVNPSGFESADWITEVNPNQAGCPNSCITLGLPQFSMIPTTGAQFNWSYHLSLPRLQTNVHRIYQSYDQNGFCYGTDYICQAGIVPSAVYGSNDSSVFYSQYLVDASDLSTSLVSVSPHSGGSGTLITGTVPVTNPSKYDVTHSGTFGSGGIEPVNLGLEMGILNSAVPSVSTVTADSNPHFAAYDPQNGYLYVANEGANTVSVIEPGGARVSVPVGSAPLFPAYDPINGYIYVPNSGGSTVSVIYGTSLVSGGTLTVGTNPHSVEFDSYNGYLYVANWGSGSVSVVKGTSVLPSAISVGSGPLFAVPIGSLVYVANSGESSVNVIAVTTSGGYTTNTHVPLPFGANPHTAVFDPSDGYVYIPDTGPVLTQAGYVTVMQGASVIQSIPAGNSPLFADYDPQNGYVYVTMNGGHSVWALSGTSEVQGGTIFLSSYYPVDILYDPSTALLYVTVTNDNSVNIIGGPLGLSDISSAPASTAPWGLAYDSETNRVISMNSGTSTITYLDPLNPPTNDVCWDSVHATSVGQNTLAFYKNNGTPSPTSSLKVCGNLVGGSYYMYQFKVLFDGTTPNPFLSNTTVSSFENSYFVVN